MFHSHFTSDFPLITDAPLQERLFLNLGCVRVCAVDAPQMKKAK